MPTSLLKLPIRLTAGYLRFAGAALRGLAELIDTGDGQDAADSWAPSEPAPDIQRPEPEADEPRSDSRRTAPPRERRAPGSAPGASPPPAAKPDSAPADGPVSEAADGPVSEPAGPPSADPTPRRRPAPAPSAPLDAASGHVSEEAVLVGESADPGAADGAGPEINVEEPWPGYRAQAAAEVIDRLAGESDSAVALAQLYEQMHRGRRTVLAAAERELRRRNPPGSGSRAT